MSHHRINIPPGGNYANDGSISIQSGDSLTIGSTSAISAFLNNGIVYDFGSVKIGTNLEQTNNSQIDVYNNGHLTLTGASEGGIIGIQSGMLELARAPQFLQPAVGSYSASNLLTGVAFTGTTGAIEFDGVKGPIGLDFRPGMQDILVSTGRYLVADIHLIPGFNPYSAAEFSPRGNELTFHFIREGGYMFPPH